MIVEIVLGILSFTVIVNVMVAIILLARSQLVSTGDVTIEINNDPTQKITVPAGGKLLQTLAENNLFLSSACGGGGTCAQCRCQVLDGGGSIASWLFYHVFYVPSSLLRKSCSCLSNHSLHKAQDAT